ncbi:SacI domain protein [Aspergillus campestris IBT 28561]|uniref:SacI domain protein n=1 Tax=Aspergillus campestris (strain IBT 28561) TaxID=1392248 RepID=A0A2I1DH31_ASPC2|nr:SacI domain protein [Aspergillus campestris IBT 28561]PKY09176.1 SacI domain protein [Aspergillus campestris IBT 28561]
MPGLLRKLVIFAAVDGLILQPPAANLRNYANNDSALLIDYKTGRVSSLPASASELSERDSGLEAYGLVGLLSVASYSFLIAITQRQQVAQIQGKPVYAVTNIAVIPTSSMKDASHAIAQARESSRQGNDDDDDEQDEIDSDGTASDSETDAGDTEVGTAPSSPIQTEHSPHNRSNSIAEDVMGKRVPFGRFAANWLSRKTLGLPGLGTVDHDGNGSRLDTKDADVQGSPTGSDTEEALAASGSESSPERGEGPSSSPSGVELLPKLLRYTKLIFASHNFFFAYDYDLTRNYGTSDLSAKSLLPPHKVADELYFWNRHLMAPFIGAGAHSYVLPLMQGFVGQREFTVAGAGRPSTEASDSARPEGRMLGETSAAEAMEAAANKRDFLLTLISRRSVKRPGLRYLRRGVDDDGNTANTVETEQILSVPDWDPAHRVYSYLQIRGSIPLYFSQSPYALKPVPILHHSTETNELAFEKHFRSLSRRYGKVQAVSLIDKLAGELKLGNEFDKYTNECRGMKFENVSRLVDRLKPTLEEYGDTMVQSNTVLRTQAGIIRTNCMDCLDRTGVAQCAFAQWALERELQSEGIDLDLASDSSTQWFNTLWADNGDAISKQYSSTAALKGDYTRTRKRDYRGALNDFGLTLTRYFNNIVNDYFSQACIDYLLGNVSTQVFQEFATELQTADPGISVQKLRQNAIDTSCRIVISDPSEEFLGGWTMLTPREPNTLRTLPFEESVLLLTDAAVYNCRFDWDTDKVMSSERVSLRSISRINHGTYITSTLTTAQTSERHNVGLVIEYREGDTHDLRVNTRSLHSSVDTTALDNTSAARSSEWPVSSWFKGLRAPTTRLMAFKALPVSNSVTQTRTGSPAVSEGDWVRSICEEIQRAVLASPDTEGLDQLVVEKGEIISLEDARKRTGILETLVHDVKKLVWA